MKVLVVDSETAGGTELTAALASQGHEPAITHDGGEALARLDREDFDMVFADAKAPTFSGIEILRQVKQQGNRAEVVVMSSNGSVAMAIQAVQLGAFEFVAKPLTAAIVAALVTRYQIRSKPFPSLKKPAVQSASADTNSTSKMDALVVGSSEGIRRVKHMIRVSARTNANVLIYGETGTGKDLVSWVIHQMSHRNEDPFIKVGCTLLPESLIESELYGHEEGSFTGAEQHRKGRFELAEGGTIYLDDVDDIPLLQQAKLLRVIEEKVFERVGGTAPIQANVRIVASSKKNLLAKIGEGTFREDLYYRLDVLRIRIPPLRDRREDVPALVDHLLARIADGEACHIDPQAIVLLAQHDWPGNVRELYHTLERAYLLGSGHISAKLIETEMDGPGKATTSPTQPPRGGFQSVMQHAEKQLLLSSLDACGGNKTAAAGSLGMKVSTFRDKLSKHGIK